MADLSAPAQSLASAIATSSAKAAAATGTMIRRKITPSTARVIRLALLIISVGAHGVAIFLIARLLWQLRKAQQLQHRRGLRSRLMDRMQSDGHHSTNNHQNQGSDSGSSSSSSPRQENGAELREETSASQQQQQRNKSASQLQTQLETVSAERDALQRQVQTLSEEKTALATSKKSLEDEIAQSAASTSSLQQQNKTLRAENLHTKEMRDTLVQENEALRIEIRRLTERLEILNKAQDALQPNPFVMPTIPTLFKGDAPLMRNMPYSTISNGETAAATTTTIGDGGEIDPTHLNGTHVDNSVDEDARSDTSSVSGQLEFDNLSSTSSSRSTSPRQHSRRMRQPIIGAMPAFMRFHNNPAMMAPMMQQQQQQHSKSGST